MKWKVFLICLLFSQIGFGQSVPRLKEIADDLFEKRQYIEAIEFYDKIVGLDKGNLECKYQLALCYDLTLQYEKAKSKFVELAQIPDQDYRALSTYYYANLLKHEKEFIVADSLFSELVSYPSATPDLVQLSKKHQAGCQLGMRQQQRERGFSVDLMEGDINSKFHDFGATVNPATQQLVISSTRHNSKSQYEGSQYDGLLPDLMAFSQDRGKWRNTTSEREFRRVNTHWSEGSGSFTHDGKSFYFTSCVGEEGSDCSIMVSYLIDNQWTTPKALNEYVNEPGSENKHPFVTANGDTLFFASDRPGGFGETDIWMSLKGRDLESWTPAINLGNVINSPEKEITPYFSTSFNCLLFASDGHVGYGGFDIYAAHGVSFFQPEIYNLGPPFNTSWDETYFHISDSAGFLSSNRENGRILKVYEFDVSDEKLFLSLLISGESLIDSRIVSRFKDVTALDLVTFRVEDYQGYELFEPIKYDKPKPKIIMEAEAEIAAEQSRDTIQNQSSTPGEPNIAANNDGSANNQRQNSNSSQNALIANDVFGGDLLTDNSNRFAYETQYFEYGLYELRPETQKSLDQLAVEIKNNPYQTIYLLAYTDDIGEDASNLELSRHRGEAIKSYLTSEGLPENRIQILARGALKPDGPDHWFYRVLRRKVEIIVETETPPSFNLPKHFIVRKDATVQQVATELSLTEESLKDSNNLTQESLKAGSVIRVSNYQEPSEKVLLDESDVQRIFLNNQIN